MDFSYQYTNSGSFLDTWDQLKHQILKFLLTDNHVKDKNTLEVLTQLSSNEINSNTTTSKLSLPCIVFISG